jgi:hypothetical protein
MGSGAEKVSGAENVSEGQKKVDFSTAIKVTSEGVAGMGHWEPLQGGAPAVIDPPLANDAARNINWKPF